MNKERVSHFSLVLEIPPTETKELASIIVTAASKLKAIDPSASDLLLQYADMFISEKELKTLGSLEPIQ